MNNRTQDRLLRSLFRTVLFILLILSGLSIAGNLVFGFPFSVNIKWILIFLFAVLTFFLSKNNRKSYFWKLLFFIVITYVVIPLGWFDSGGSENYTLSYMFLLMICTTFFFWGKTRLVLVLSQVGIFFLLLLTEHVYPEFVKDYDAVSQFYDQLFQIPLTLLAGFLFLRIFANAYNNERIRLNHLVQFDSLTNLYNRRSFDFIFKKTLDTVEKNEQEAYLLFFDLDDFKQINDDKGHIIGDQVLIEVSVYTKRLFENQGIVARWGGDEFAVIFKGNQKDLLNILEELHDFKFSLSTGVVKITGQNQSVDELFKQADRALYEAKKAGKGRYYFHTDKVLNPHE